jgi:hypothetical protein
MLLSSVASLSQTLSELTTSEYAIPRMRVSLYKRARMVKSCLVQISSPSLSPSNVDLGSYVHLVIAHSYFWRR